MRARTAGAGRSGPALKTLIRAAFPRLASFGTGAGAACRAGMVCPLPPVADPDRPPDAAARFSGDAACRSGGRFDVMQV